MMVNAMTYNQYYICHHGIKGQKHGVRNGPPYPLDYSKLSAEERNNAKTEAVNTGNIKEANKNIRYFSNKDIDDLITRFEKQNKIRGLASKDIKTGQQKLKEWADKLDSIAKVGENGIRVFNVFAKVGNAVKSVNDPNSKPWPIIGESKPKGNDNNKNDNDNNKNDNKKNDNKKNDKK